MTYRVIVKLEVIDECGDSVTEEGYVARFGRDTPLSTGQEFSSREEISDAHRQMNTVFALIRAASELTCSRSPDQG